MSGRIEVSRDGHVAEVRLVHTGKLNAMSRAMWRQLRDVFAALQDDTARCVVVRGDAGAFCAGGDISEYPGFRFSEPGLRAFHEEEVWGGLAAMLACDVPLIACIEGPCMGAGMEIASCCDLRLAGSSARFGAPIARLGFPMAPREAQLVARVAGELTAREMLLGAAALDAPTLLARGFLNQVLPDADLPAEVSRIARRTASLAPRAARLNKQTFRALNSAFVHIPRDSAAMETIVHGAYAYADTPEHREGIAAFLEKRPPAF